MAGLSQPPQLLPAPALNLALCLFLLAQFSGRTQHASRS